MKKTLLRSLLVAATLMAGTSVWAQKDVTSQYIKNATLSNGLNGWTAVNFDNPQRGNNTVGYACEAYSGWGSFDVSSYSLTQNITLPKGNYTLVNYSFYREGETVDYNPEMSRAFLKAGNAQIAIKTLGSITTGGYANSKVDGANVFDSKMYRNALDFTVESDNTTLEIGLVGTFEMMRSWCIAGMFELIDRDQIATVDGPFDVTGNIVNPGFEYRNTDGWTLEYEGDLSNGYIFQTQSNNTFSAKTGGYYVEAWQSDGALSDRKMYQVVNNLPNGLYQLSVYASYSSNGAYVKANENVKAVEPGPAKKYIVSTVVTDGTLTIEAGVAGGEANYLCFDRFELLFCGDVVAMLNGLVDQANALLSKPFWTEIRDQLNAAIEAANSPADYLKAIDDLAVAIDNAKTSIAAYQRLEAALMSGNDFLKKAIEEFGAPTACETALDEIYRDYENGAVADDQIDDKIAEIDQILVNVARQQTVAGADMTRMIVNPDFERDEYGWTVNAAAGDGPSDRAGNVRPGGTAENHCYEAWNNSNFDIYQEVAEAKAGVYEIEVQGFYRYGRNQAWADYLAQTVDYVKPNGVPVYVYLNNNATNFTNVFGDEKQITDETFYSMSSSDYSKESLSGTDYFFPNGMQSAAVAFSDGMYKQSAFGLVEKDGDQLRIGVKGNSSQLGDSWVIWDNFKLIYRGFDPAVIKPVLEVAMADVQGLEGMLMGKTPYANLSKALDDAAAAIENNDGEAMFKALNDLYNVKAPAQESKDLFLNQEVATDTLDLYNALESYKDVALSAEIRQEAKDLLKAIVENTRYENEEIAQLKEDVTAMVTNLAKSIVDYESLKSHIDELADEIVRAQQTNEQHPDAHLASLIVEAQSMQTDETNNHATGAYKSCELAVKRISDMIDALSRAMDVATAINQLTVKPADDADAYNLGGQRVAKGQKGLLIKDGQKVLRK